jgi:hypothetical protein
MARQHRDTRVTAGRALIRRYVLALPPPGAGNEAGVPAASVPPLSGSPDVHGSAAAAHAFTLADSVGGGLCHDGLCGRRYCVSGARRFWDDERDRGAYGLAAF